MITDLQQQVSYYLNQEVGLIKNNGMMNYMKIKKIVVSGLIAGLAAFLVGNVLYMNPIVTGLYPEYSDWPGMKPMDYFGGLGNWLILMLVGGLISTILLTVLYSYTEKGLDMKSVWKKGLIFGILLWFVSTLPNSYYTWLMYTYPEC